MALTKMMIGLTRKFGKKPIHHLVLQLALIKFNKPVNRPMYQKPAQHRPQKPERPRGVSVTISVACFVPKPFTPFQWEAQDSYESLVEKQRHLAECITDKKIRYTYHDAKVSRVEAILARGDRRVGKAIARAVELGANLEAWDEFFDYDRWMQSFADAGLDPDFYTTRGFGEDEILPWDMIDIGVTKAFLLRERKNAYAEKTTPSCAEQCSGCGANKLGGKNRWCK